VTIGEILQNTAENTDSVFSDSRLSNWAWSCKEIEKMKRIILEGYEINTNQNLIPSGEKSIYIDIPMTPSDKFNNFDMQILKQDAPRSLVWPVVVKPKNLIHMKSKLKERKRKRKSHPTLIPFLDQLKTAGSSGKTIRKRVLSEPFKLFGFAENRRPIFYGLCRSSRTVRARNPFAKDKNIEYHNDSDFSADEVKDGDEDIKNHSTDSREEGEQYEIDDMIVFTKDDFKGSKKKGNKNPQEKKIYGFYHSLEDVRAEDNRVIDKCCVLLCSDEKFPLSVKTRRD